MTQPNLDAIRRIADSGVPIPPWIVRQLIEEIEREKGRAESDLADLRQLQGAYDSLWRERNALLAAARAWDAAIERCDGIAAAEQALRKEVRKLKS